MKILIIVGAALAGVLLFLLATASADTSLFAENYPVILVLNAALAGLLATIVGYQLTDLARKFRRRVFGSRLTLRLLSFFALMALAPGLLVYLVSVQFLTKSIESWFDVKVDAALEGGIRLGQSAMDQMLADLQLKGRAMALELADKTPAQQVVLLDRLRENAGASEAVVVAASGKLIASASRDLTRLLPELPNLQMLRQARGSRSLAAIDSPVGKPLTLRVLLPISGGGLADEPRYLQLRQAVPESLARSAEDVESAFRDYRELAISRLGLKRIYVVTLTLALLMALFVAIALAVVLANRLSEPLSNLAHATQAVARGDFSRKAPVTSRDELGVLTESFNSMTRQLGDARGVLEANRVALETANAHLENILANLSAGVLVLDRALRLSITNHGAAAILGEDLIAASGKSLGEWRGGLEYFAGPVRQAIVQHEGVGWQLELNLKGTGKTLLVRGATMPEAGGGGHVLVFDDVTQLIQAQRANAWGEVARRLAHEIKNPLTPIQLSAERLEVKLADKLPFEESETLKRSTRTIVNQVNALKSMVDDFADYARLRGPLLTRMDLNSLVVEVLDLYQTSTTAVTQHLAPGLPAVYADPAQIRQVLHNLLQNAQDALLGLDTPQIEVRTSLVGDRVCLTVADNGAGFPDELMARVFDPYVTTKPRGTGLGLAIVKKIVDEHRGEVSIQNRRTAGASVSVFLPMASGAQSAAVAA
ncbi:MAG: ATP-binding protein [Betaproteobacteria bacterium]|nr:ATP-binding protein [Betaproteobacteria bacterium]